MIHPDTELRYINDAIGYGVFAICRIPRGTIVWVQDNFDQVFSPQEVEHLPKPYCQLLEKYSFVDSQGRSVLCWDFGKYLNHHCNASCLSPHDEFVLAVRDIEPGEELTEDYGTLNLEEPFVCACGAPGCRQRILPDDLLHYSEEWDAMVREVLPLIPTVAQPLWWLLQEKVELSAALANLGTSSICSLYYRPAHEC